MIEELIGTEIVDETDQFVDNLRQQKVRAMNSRLMLTQIFPQIVVLYSQSIILAQPITQKERFAGERNRDDEKSASEAPRSPFS